MQINKRLFGSDIPEKIKQKLEARQKAAENTKNPLDSVLDSSYGSGEKTYKDLLNNQFQGYGELSSRTPFVRMWTAISIVDIIDVEAEKEMREDGYFQTTEFADKYGLNEDMFVYEKRTGVAWRDAREKAITEHIKSLRGVDLSKSGGISMNKFTPETEKPIETTKVYQITNFEGNESYQNNMNPNNSVQEESGWAKELEDNKFLKPKSGITSVSSETEGSMGVIKKTSITFLVHNFQDFDQIYNRYFMKPGATVFIDFGWDSLREDAQLYNPMDLINSGKNNESTTDSKETGAKNVKEFLYSDGIREDGTKCEQGILHKNQGDLEVLQGIVTDYDAKILPNGSVECSLTITSGNSSMLENEIHTKLITKIKNMIKYSLLYIVANKFSEFEIIGGKSVKSYLKGEIASIGDDKIPTVDSYRALNENMFAIAAQTVGNGELVPNGDAVRTGVYIDQTSMVDTYMSIGLFEDLIINSQFGFGNGEDDINKGQNLQVRLDSSSTFTTFTTIFHEKQRKLSMIDSEKNPVVLFPEWWGASEQQYQVEKSSAENFFQDYHEKAGDLTEKQWQSLGSGYNSDKNLTFYQQWLRFVSGKSQNGFRDEDLELSGLAGFGELPNFSFEQEDNLIGWRTDGKYSYEETRLESSKLPKTQHRKMILKALIHMEQEERLFQSDVAGLSRPASYSYQVGKYNSEAYIGESYYYETSDLYSESTETGIKSGQLMGGGILADSATDYYVEAIKTNYAQDIELNRIPIRELFVKTEVIIKALDSYSDGGNVRNVIEDVLKEIKKDTVGVVDLVISKGESDSELRLIDKQKLQVQDEMVNDTKKSTLGTNTQNEEGEFFKELFKFNINSANSIVKNYDLNFKLPSGNIGNMYAIQASSGNTSQILPLTDRLSQALSLSSLRDDNKKDSSGTLIPKKLVYEPYLSDYRAQQLETIDKNIGMKSSYTTADELLNSGGYRIKTSAGTPNLNPFDDAIIKPETYHQNKVSKPKKDNKQDKDDTKNDGLSASQRKAIKDREELEKKEELALEKQKENYRFAKELNEQAGQTFVDSYTDYYNLLLNVNVKTVQTPTLLPLELVLTTYGVSTIQPGDIFRVDYLPEVYAQNVYFQVIKVSHQIDKTGWNTTLETQFRIVPGKTNFKRIEDKDVVYDKKMIEIHNFMNADYKDPGGSTLPKDFRLLDGESYKLGRINKAGTEGTKMNSKGSKKSKYGAYYFTCVPAWTPSMLNLATANADKRSGKNQYQGFSFGNRKSWKTGDTAYYQTVRDNFTEKMLNSMTQITPLRNLTNKYKHITEIIEFKWLGGKDSFAQPNRMITFPINPNATYNKLATETEGAFSKGNMKRYITNAIGYGCPWYVEPYNKTPGKTIHEKFAGGQWQFRNGDIFSHGDVTRVKVADTNINDVRENYGAFRNQMLDDRIAKKTKDYLATRGFQHWPGWFVPNKINNLQNLGKTNETVYWDDPNNSLSNGAGSYANFILLASEDILYKIPHYLILQKIDGQGYWAIVTNLNHIKRYDFPLNAVYDGPESGFVSIPVGDGIRGCWNPSPHDSYTDKGVKYKIEKGPYAPPAIISQDGFGAPDLTVNHYTNASHDYTPPDIPKPTVYRDFRTTSGGGRAGQYQN